MGKIVGWGNAEPFENNGITNKEQDSAWYQLTSEAPDLNSYSTVNNGGGSCEEHAGSTRHKLEDSVSGASSQESETLNEQGDHPSQDEQNPVGQTWQSRILEAIDSLEFRYREHVSTEWIGDPVAKMHYDISKDDCKRVRLLVEHASNLEELDLSEIVQRILLAKQRHIANNNAHLLEDIQSRWPFVGIVGYDDLASRNFNKLAKWAIDFYNNATNE